MRLMVILFLLMYNSYGQFPFSPMYISPSNPMEESAKWEKFLDEAMEDYPSKEFKDALLEKYKSLIEDEAFSGDLHIRYEYNTAGYCDRERIKRSTIPDKYIDSIASFIRDNQDESLKLKQVEKRGSLSQPFRDYKLGFCTQRDASQMDKELEQYDRVFNKIVSDQITVFDSFPAGYLEVEFVILPSGYIQDLVVKSSNFNSLHEFHSIKRAILRKARTIVFKAVSPEITRHVYTINLKRNRACCIF